ncbi:hypothetical protein SHIRM173S_07042 [Streptomyces hirsutus]
MPPAVDKRYARRRTPGAPRAAPRVPAPLCACRQGNAPSPGLSRATPGGGGRRRVPGRRPWRSQGRSDHAAPRNGRAGPIGERVGLGRGLRPRRAAAHHRPAGRPLHGLRRPFCHEACPLGNLIPDWNDLVARDDWRAAAERLHATNNFPEFTETVPGALRGGMCARHQPARRDHQERRVRHSRPGLGGRLRRAGPAGPAPRPDGRRDRLGSHRTGRGPAAHPCGAHGRRVRAGRPDRRADAVRHPRVQDGEAPSGAAHRADAGRGDEVPYVHDGRARCRRRRTARVTTPWSSPPGPPRGGNWPFPDGN